MSFRTAPGDVFGLYARDVVHDFDESIKARLRAELGSKADLEANEVKTEAKKYKPEADRKDRIGIIGAGVGGLYTALILDSLGITYEILEASNRTGGRLYTYHFKGGGEYEYYDVGAMRFPLPKKEDGVFVNGVMRRLAKLIEYPPLNDPAKSGSPEPLQSKLIPYYFNSDIVFSRPGILYFNGVHERTRARHDDPPRYPDFNSEELGIGEEYREAGVAAIVKDVVEPFTRLLSRDLDRGVPEGRGWRALKANDHYSMRGYMSSKYMPSFPLDLYPGHLPTNVIDYAEMLSGSTASWDQGLAETVLATMAFAQDSGSNVTNVDWTCFDGGSQTLTNYMERYLSFQRQDNPMHFGKRVTAISSTAISNDDSSIEVSVTDESSPRPYTHVISTLPLPVYRTIDMKKANMSVMQQTAIRQLQHTPAIKIGIRFKEPWWTTKLGIIGGQSYTDLPIRRVVYPSYGASFNSASNVLIACYTTSSDAYRLSALAVEEKQDQGELKNLVLRNLAELHDINDERAPYFKVTYEFLERQFEDMHVFEWNNDRYTMSAFAMFGPGNFKNMYPAMITPAADGHLYFASEAISPRHGWVVGALDSAWRAVDTYLHTTEQPEKRKLFREKWGNNMEWAEPRKGEPTPMSGIPEGEPDFLDDHSDLMKKAILAGVVKMG